MFELIWKFCFVEENYGPEDLWLVKRISDDGEEHIFLSLTERWVQIIVFYFLQEPLSRGCG